MIENLARHIREAGRGRVGDGIEVRCPWAIAQMKQFVVKPNGRAEAGVGHHDDDVLALAIGLQNLDAGRAYVEFERAPWTPADLRGLDRGRSWGGQWS